MTRAARTFTLTVTAPVPPGTPAWFVSMPEKTWTTVASSSTVIAASAGQSNAFTRGQGLSLTTWNGGCVDQVRGELLLPAVGGHSSYAGNETYALRVKAAVTLADIKWYRLEDCSPPNMCDPLFYFADAGVCTSNLIAGQGSRPMSYAAMYKDGRMRSSHTANTAVYWNGKIWFHTQASTWNEQGDNSDQAWAYTRPASPSAPGQSPIAWANNPGAWTWLGTSSKGSKGNTSTIKTDSVADGSNDPPNATYGLWPASAIDVTTGRIWSASAGRYGSIWGYIDTADSSIHSTVYNAFGPGGESCGWATIVYDPTGADRWRYFVTGGRAGALYILNLKHANPLSLAAWTELSVSDTSILTTPGLGAVYHPPSKSILIGGPTAGGYPLASGKGFPHIMKLTVPTNGDGTFNNIPTWVVTPVPPAGGVSPSTNFPIRADNFGCYSRFNIINDMGNGQSLLVYVPEHNGPTYLYKLPAAGV